MKLLAVDVGNSRIKWGLHEAGRWIRSGVLATAEAQGVTGAFADLPRPHKALVANVAGEDVARCIADALASVGVTPQWVVGRDEQCGVRSSYAEPQRLGPDRWAALIAARHLHEGPCVVVNAGTTMTVDGLSAEGIFLGGFIVPGYALMREALARNTALLKLQQGRFSFFPDNTGDAISSGALNALAGAVDRMSSYMRDTEEGEALIVLSGGDAAALAPMLREPRLVDNLVLEGLVCIGARDG